MDDNELLQRRSNNLDYGMALRCKRCQLLSVWYRERTGNTPLEAMVFEYAQLKGTLDGMDTTVITELAEYFEKELGYVQPSRTPFVGRNFNVTRAGIHADGHVEK